MREAAAVVVGTHDFAAFRSVGGEVRTTIRTITESAFKPQVDPGLLTYEITGDGFLRHMVRALAGTLVEIGRGQRPPSSMPALLSGASRGEAGATAPPQGLFLVRVVYD
jgi:tRNA pseudouridine38-40 synthase